MNAATARAIEQLKEARETLDRANDDPTLTSDERWTIWDARNSVHDTVLTLAVFFRK